MMKSLESISIKGLFVGMLLALAANQAMAKDLAPQPTQSLETVKTLQVEAWVDVDALGQLTELTFESKLPDRMREVLDGTVRTWRFLPIVVDGVPKASKAKMRITLAARKTVSGHQVTVENVRFPDTNQAKLMIVDNASARISVKSMHRNDFYPAQMARTPLSCFVLLGIKIGADGRVDNVVAIQSSLLDVDAPPAVLRQAVFHFEQAALRQARLWRFNVTAKTLKLDAKDMTIRINVPFERKRQDTDLAGVWRTEIRTSLKPMDWMPQEAQKIGVSDVAAGEMLSANETIRLATDVTGTVLL
jgi:hypothetical protein